MKRCPICGKTYPDKLSFCTRCGTSLEAVEQSQEVPKQNDDTATEYLSDGEIVIKVTKSQTFAYEIRCTSTSIDIEKLESKEEEEQESEETTAAKKTITEY